MKKRWHSREVHIYLLDTSCFIAKWIIKIGWKLISFKNYSLWRLNIKKLCTKLAFALVTLWLEWWRQMNKGVLNLSNRIAVKLELAAEEQRWQSLRFWRTKLIWINCSHIRRCETLPMLLHKLTARQIVSTVYSEV